MSHTYISLFFILPVFKPFSSDILRELATFGESPVRSLQSPPASHKRDREDALVSLPTPPLSDGRTTDDDSTRPRKPIPRGKQPSQPQPSDNMSSSPASSPVRSHQTPPSTGANLLTGRGPQWLGPTGGVTISPNQPMQPYPVDLSPDGNMQTGINGDNMIPSFFDAALFGPALSGNTNRAAGPASMPAAPSSSTSSLGSLQGAASLPWEGILSQQQNPYGGAFGAPGIDFFNPYVGYQGPGGPLGFAAEAQAFLGDEDTVNWQDALNMGCVTFWPVRCLFALVADLFPAASLEIIRVGLKNNRFQPLLKQHSNTLRPMEGCTGPGIYRTCSFS